MSTQSISKLKLFGTFMVFLTAAHFVTSCGGSASTEEEQIAAAAAGQNGGAGAAATPAPGTPGGTVVQASPTPTPAPGGSTGDSGAPYTYSFSVTGTGGTQDTFTSPTVTTDTKLRVRINAGTAGKLSLPGSQYSRYEATYGCVSYEITVAGKTVRTSPLNVGGSLSFCPTAQNNQVIDFSDRMTPGHGPVRVQVKNPKYDFYCMFYYNTVYAAQYCPMTTVYKNHVTTGTLDIEVNGTTL